MESGLPAPLPSLIKRVSGQNNMGAANGKCFFFFSRNIDVQFIVRWFRTWATKYSILNALKLFLVRLHCGTFCIKKEKDSQTGQNSKPPRAEQRAVKTALLHYKQGIFWFIFPLLLVCSSLLSSSASRCPPHLPPLLLRFVGFEIFLVLER